MNHGNAVTQVVTDEGVRAFPDEELVHLSPNVTRVRMATAAALAACTLTGNVLEADAVGSVGAIDTAVTPAVGDLILLKNQVAGLQNGVFEFLQVGGAAEKFKLRRSIGWDVSARVKGGKLVVVSEGTANGNSAFMLTTNDPIVLNTTALVFGSALASAPGAGSITTAMLDADAVTQAKLNNNAHAGTCTLVAGTVTVTDTAITANSRILLTRTTQAGTVTSTVSYDVVTKNVGASFVVQACVAAGTINVADASVLDYLVIETE